jgi:hypothetical protein
MGIGANFQTGCLRESGSRELAARGGTASPVSVYGVGSIVLPINHERILLAINIGTGRVGTVNRDMRRPLVTGLRVAEV